MKRGAKNRARIVVLVVFTIAWIWAILIAWDLLWVSVEEVVNMETRIGENRNALWT